MKFLLGATAALLLGAIFMSWQGMRQGVKSASPEEIAQLRTQIAELRQEMQKRGQSTGNSLAAQPPTGLTIEEQLAEAEAAQAAVARQAELDAKLQIEEDGLIAQRMLESKDDELRRARLISQALLMGKVTDYVDDPQYGGFITLDVMMPEQVQVGSILGIRRNNTGILYRFKVSDVAPEGAIANPVTAIGDIKPQRGDELIFPPLD